MADQEITGVASEFKPIVLNPDGTYTRAIPDSCTPATPDPNSDAPVLSKDVPLNPINKTSVRIYLPKQALDRSAVKKLPIIVYYHGGGFVFCSHATDSFHEFCNGLAADIAAVVVSVDYRLAPEHRLPVAYEDSFEALHWIKTTHEPWLTEFADFSRCYLMGTSAGANIVYHVGLRLAAEGGDLDRLKIKGLILHHPFFSGSKRVKSEIRLGNEGPVNLSLCDLLWDLSLPIGKDRDHDYSNPMVGDGPDNPVRIQSMGLQVFVACCFGDLLIDRQMEFVKMFQVKDVECVTHVYEGYHSLETFEPSKAKDLFVVIKRFIFFD